MNVRMVGHCRAPAVEHGGGADASAEVLGIGGDREHTRLAGPSPLPAACQRDGFL